MTANIGARVASLSVRASWPQSLMMREGLARFRAGLMSLVLWLPFDAISAERYEPGATLIASSEAGWPQFRGPRRDGISDERGLLQSWPESGPKQLWSTIGAGRGFSSPIVAGGRVYLTGDFNDELYVVAYDLKGKPLWRTKNGAAWLNQYQGARGSVTYSAGLLY